MGDEGTHDEGERPEVFRWDEITTVSHRVTHNYVNGRYKSSYFLCELTRQDGVTLRLRSSYDDPQYKRRADPGNPDLRYVLLGRRAEEHVTRALYPRAVAALRRGESLTSGKFIITSYGIQDGSDLVPWAEAHVSAGAGCVMVRAGTRRAKSYGGPNASLLLALADHFRSGR